MDLVDRLKIQPTASQFLRTGDPIQSLIAEREEAAERIERLQLELLKREWQPIETAPKDGTRILLYRSGLAENMAVGYWDSTWSEFRPVGGSFFQGATRWAPLLEPPQ